MRYALFFTVIVLANIIQGITGFAGTILAMPASLLLVGYGIAKPVLNVLGVLSGVYVFVGNSKSVNWKEFGIIAACMTVGIFTGIWCKQYFAGKEYILYKGLGVFVILIAIQGLFTMLCNRNAAENTAPGKNNKVMIALLPLAGIVHGIFVCGGPLLISYLIKRINDKVVFRATISTVWIVLNTIIFIDDFHNGYFTMSLLPVLLIAVPLLFVGMMIGTALYKRMNQRLFMLLTYVLLFISGATLLIK
ncbi:MAG: sulfite exporter TauE/SafE family protein [Treponema sp.]|nr:sulfite exporter TauE/SafE family protein [Treponema sp.]